MRRLTSIFTSKRSTKSDVSSDVPTSSKNQSDKKKKAFQRLRALNVTPIITPSLSKNPSTLHLLVTNTGQSSGDSSSGSASLRTPDDDVMLARTPTKKFWISWLGAKGQRSPQPDWDAHTQDWASPRLPMSQPPHHGRLLPAEDTDDETSSEDEDQSESLSHSDHTFSSRATLTADQSRKNLQILTSNKLVSPASPPPLLHIPGAPLFPRSCNLSRLLPTQLTLLNTMHRRRLLRHLEDPLTRDADTSILPFASRPALPVTRYPPEPLDDILSPDRKCISGFSRGLKRWTSRACFEERMVVWTPEDDTGEVRSSHVKGTAFAVAELELSESVEVLAGFMMDVDQLEGNPRAPPSSSSLQVPVDARKLPYKTMPSPLRMQHCPSPGQISPSTSMDALNSGAKLSTPSTTALVDPPNSSVDVTPGPTTVKRGVRFAEDNKDDQIPLGYVLRMKKRREEKAKFLQEEKERRAFEEERLKMEEERKKREAERSEWEKERKAWEREKRAIEEERKQKLYAEELAAARRRRESQRGGVTLGTSASSPSLSGEPDFQATRNTKRYSRPVYDSIRKQASDPVVLYPGSEPPSPNKELANSRLSPNSGTSQPGSRQNSRPSSIHSNYSTDDGPVRGGGSGARSKRNSKGSTTSIRPQSDRASTWSPGHIPPMPVFPTMPLFPIDTPLLPPAPPFMMQQYPRPNRQSTSPRTSGVPGNHNSTQANQQQLSNQRRPGSSSSSPGRQEGQFRTPTLPREHQRRSSGDDHRTSSSTTSQNGRSTSQPPVGRSHRPQPSSLYLQPPPTSMNKIHSSSSLSNGLSQRPHNRRQATIS